MLLFSTIFRLIIKLSDTKSYCWRDLVLSNNVGTLCKFVHTLCTMLAHCLNILDHVKCGRNAMTKYFQVTMVTYSTGVHLSQNAQFTRKIFFRCVVCEQLCHSQTYPLSSQIFCVRANIVIQLC